jgi:PKD repeat protein
MIANDSPGVGPGESAQTLQVTAISATSQAGGTVVLAGSVVTYTPPAGFYGSDSFTYTIQDNGTTNGQPDPKTAVGTVMLTVNFVNKLPVASAGGSTTNALCGVPLGFDGSGSHDPDGTVASYEWDFGDGTTGSGVRPSHTYLVPGIYTASLVVIDNLGGASPKVTLQVTVAPFSANDTDGDGYPDKLELALGTDPGNAASHPNWGVTGAPVFFSVSTFTLNLSFASSGKDSLALAGVLPGAVTPPATMPFVCANFSAVYTPATLKLSKAKNNQTPFKLSLSKATLTSAFASAGFGSSPAARVPVSIFIGVGNVLYQANVNVKWAVSRGKGTSKLAS